MLDRFNFYDIFGYFIPGCVCLASLFLPFGIVASEWPSADVASALAAVLLAYLVGHYLQAIASQAVPSSKGGRSRSSVMLDHGQHSLPEKWRKDVATLARACLGIDLTETQNQKQDDMDALRDAAFFEARDQLIAADRSRYLEQFQALYSMMRGNLTAAGVGSAYVIGWIASNPWLGTRAMYFLPLLAAAHLLSLAWPPADSGSARERRLRDQTGAMRSLVSLLVLAAGAGIVLGAGRISDQGDRRPLLALLIGLLALGIQSWRRYGFYADEFAKAVYRGFIQLHLHPPPKKAE